MYCGYSFTEELQISFTISILYNLFDIINLTVYHSQNLCHELQSKRSKHDAVDCHSNMASRSRLKSPASAFTNVSPKAQQNVLILGLG